MQDIVYLNQIYFGLTRFYIKKKKQGNFFHEIYFQKRLYFKTTCEIEKSKCDLDKKRMCINLKCSRWIELPFPIVKCFLLSEV